MSIIGKILKTTIDIATIPVSVVADVVTLGGVLTDKEKTYTGKHIKTLANDAVNIYKEIEKL